METTHTMITLNKKYGTHIPALLKVLSLTHGNVLELGMGIYSTPLLHWACFGKRMLVSYESIPEWYELHKEYHTGVHEVHFVKDFSEADIERPWDVAFVDHTPASRRKEEIKRLANYAKYIVVHDTEGAQNPLYHFSDIYPLFKYRYNFSTVRPNTTILSNFIDVSEIQV